MSKWRLLAKSVVLVSIVSTAFSVPVTGAPPAAPQASLPSAPLQQGGTAWYDSAWRYRRPVSVANSNAVMLTGHQVLVTLGSSFDFTKAKSDGSDVRITDGDGVSALSFWIESWSPAAQQARLWVKVPALASNGVRTLYLYYGNAVANSMSNGYDTFEFFDDFDRLQTLDSGNWTTLGGTWSVITATQQDGTVGLVANGATTARQIAYSTYSGGDYVMEAYGKQVSGRVWGLGVRVADSNNLYSINLYEDLDATNNLYLYNWAGGFAATVARTAVGAINLDTWYKLTVKAHGSSLDVYLNDVLRIQAVDAQFAAGRIALYGERTTVAQFNNVLVRKYAAVEPSVVVGAEGVQPAGLAIVISDSPDPVVAGNLLTYQITVTNLAPTPATSVTLTDTLPTGVTFASATPGAPTCMDSSGIVVCHLVDLAQNAGATVTITVNVGASAKGPLTNTVRVTSNLPSDNTVTTFTTVNYLLSVAKSGNGNGTITSNPTGIGCGSTCSGSFNYNSAVTLTASADTGAAFTGWSGNCTGTGACAVVMDAAKSVTATFTQNVYSLTVNVVGQGSAARQPDQASYHYSDVVTLTATPVTGWSFGAWSGDLSGSANPAAITIDGNKTVTANFLQGGTAWYDSAWRYRRPVSVANSNAVMLTGHQVLVTLGSSFDFTKAKSDGSDVRVTDGDGVSALSFWIESWNPAAQQGRLWVKVPALASNGVRTLYLYYGNAAANSTSSGYDSFEFFDDFDILPTKLGYYSLSSAQTVLQQSGWEPQAPHTLSVVQAPSGSYQYWGYYGLQGCGGIGIARSNDLVNWVKDPNPLFNQEGERWPSVLHVGVTFYMVYERNYCGTSHIVLRTSSDGQNFGPYQVLVAPQSGYQNQNPNLFLDPNSNLFYLYWYSNDGNPGIWQIKVRSASTVAGLADPSSERVLIAEPYSIAGPNMLYYDSTYFLSTETADGGWSTRIYASSSPIGPFSLVPDNPVLVDGSACLSQYVVTATLHTYYCKLTGSTWTVEHRTADLTAGRKRLRMFAPWVALDGTWSTISATQQDGTVGLVANGVMTTKQIAYSTYSGNDYVVEAYGKQLSGRMWGMGVRTADSNNLYSISLYEDLDATNNLYLYRWVGGQPTVVARTAVGAINQNTWYKLTVKAHGSSLDVYLNDVLRIQATDAQFAAGHIALYGEGATAAQFNNVLVRKYAGVEPSAVVGTEVVNPS